jgi:large subunit ribosomal protein L15
MQLHQVRSPLGSRKDKKIIGRGRGTGRGKRSGRGQTGQHSRSGRAVMLGFEGGQMPLLRRLPKVGFNSKWPTEYQIVNVESLEQFKDGTDVTLDVLLKANLIKSVRRFVKILSNGAVTKKLTVHGHKFSKVAADKISKAGGKVNVLPGKDRSPARETRSTIRSAKAAVK